MHGTTAIIMPPLQRLHLKRPPGQLGIPVLIIAGWLSGLLIQENTMQKSCGPYTRRNHTSLTRNDTTACSCVREWIVKSKRNMGCDGSRCTVVESLPVWDICRLLCQVSPRPADPNQPTTAPPLTSSASHSCSAADPFFLVPYSHASHQCSPWSRESQWLHPQLRLLRHRAPLLLRCRPPVQCRALPG